MHDCKGSSHYFGDWSDVVESWVGDKSILELIVVGMMSEVFPINDSRLIGNSDASSRKDPISDGLIEEIIDFGPIRISNNDKNKQKWYNNSLEHFI